MDTSADVVMVGAGPAALLLTELLARAGRSVVIVEQQADPTRVAQSVMLQPVVLGMLERLGVPALAAPEVGRIAGLEEYGPAGQLFSGRYGDLPDPPSTYGQLITQGELRRILIGHVQRFPHVTLLTSVSIDQLLRQAAGDCQVEIVDIESGERARISSDWVVAADGASSITRTLAGIDAQVWGFPHSMFLAAVPTPRGYPAVIRVHRQPVGLVVSVPEAMPGTTYLFTHTLGENRGSKDLVAGIIRAGDPVLAEVVGSSWDPANRIEITPRTVVAERWRRDGVILLGDSAHAMHSFGAQGLNISMQDAVLLGEAMSKHPEDGVAAAVDAVAHRRRHYVDSVQRAQQRLGRQFWPAEGEAGQSWFAERFDEFALGQADLRHRWQSIPAVPGADRHGASTAAFQEGA